MNAFESQLAIALKQASITAAVGVIHNNPDMTLEDFYTLVRPQGITESITMGELQAALAGQALSAAPVPRQPTAAAEASPTVAAPAKPRRPATPPEVNCLSHAGMDAYHSSILRYLAAVDGWVRGPTIMEYCGGNKGQVNIAMRKRLVPEGFVKTQGAYGGKSYAITARGEKRAARSASVKPARPQARAQAQAQPMRINGYRDIVLDFFRQSQQWQSGEDVSNACGGTISARRQAIKTLVNDGLVERNGEYTVLMRYRICQLQ